MVEGERGGRGEETGEEEGKQGMRKGSRGVGGFPALYL
jgi:hypothetical protein